MDPKNLVKAFVDAHNRHDVEGMLAFIPEDGVMVDVAAPIPLNNKDDVRRLYQMIFAAIPDIHFEITGIIAEGNQVFAAFRTTGTGTGTFMGKDVRGKSVDVQEAMFTRIERDKLQWTQFFSDTATLTAQLSYQTAVSANVGK